MENVVRAVVLSVKQKIEKCTSALTLTDFGYIYVDRNQSVSRLPSIYDALSLRVQVNVFVFCYCQSSIMCGMLFCRYELSGEEEK